MEGGWNSVCEDARISGCARNTESARNKFLDAPEIALNAQHMLCAVSKRDKHASVGGVGALPDAAGDAPGVAHHELEVLVFVDRSTDILASGQGGVRGKGGGGEVVGRRRRGGGDAAEMRWGGAL